MINWNFIKPTASTTLKEKIAYTEGYFLALSQLHSNLSIDNDDKEFNTLNIEIKKYMRDLKKLEINES